MSQEQEVVKPTEVEHSWNETIKTNLIAIVLAVVFRSFFFEPFHIPSSSMKDTLLIGDYIFVSKSSYGYSRYSFPLGLPIFDGRIFADEPKRGDVAVFRLPTNPKIDFIKRVVGLPNDEIQVKEGVLYINGKAVKRERVEDFSEKDSFGNISQVKKYRETMPNGVSYYVLDATSSGEKDDTGLYFVPEGHYFMMGDNRDNSRDSRYPNEVGFVPAENLIGRAEIVFFSIEEGSKFWQIWKLGSSLRSGRFFKQITD